MNMVGYFLYMYEYETLKPVDVISKKGVRKERMMEG
jgi:hypothetical protein